MRAPFQKKTVIQITLLMALFLTARDVFAQGTRSDYERALNLRKITADKVFKQKVTPHWLSDNIQFWYRNDLADGVREHILVNAETGVRQQAFDHERLATKLTEVTGKDIQANRLPIENLSFDEELTELKFKSHGKWWKCDLHSYDLQGLSEDEQDVSSLAVHTKVRPSRSGGNETSITFINHTKGDVQVYWIDFEGERRYYARVRLFRHFCQKSTFGRFVRILRLKSARSCQGYYRKDDKNSSDLLLTRCPFRL